MYVPIVIKKVLRYSSSFSSFTHTIT